MRYLMVLAVRQAGEGPLFAEHVFKELLELTEKRAEDIANSLEGFFQIRADIEGVCSIIATEKIDVCPTVGLIREALAGEAIPGRGQAPAPLTLEATNLLAEAERRATERGGQLITAADTLLAALAAPTPLMAHCLAKYDHTPTPKKKPTRRGDSPVP
jgi:hypothetical protein